MHRVKMHQGMVRTMKMCFYRMKNILSRYTQILVDFPPVVAGSSE